MKVDSKTAIQSFIWKLTERTSVQVAQFVLTIILARILMPYEYGIIAIVMVFISISQVIVDGGFNTALIQKKEIDDIDYSTCLVFSVFISVLMYSILFVFAPDISRFYNNPEITKVIRVLGLVQIIYAINSIQYAYVARNMLFRKLFICSFISVITSGIVGIWLAYKGFGVWALVVQTLLNQGLLSLLMIIANKWIPTLYFSYCRLKTLFSYGWKIFTTNIIVSVFVNIRKLLIGKIYTADSLAFFDRGGHFPDIIMGNINSSVQAIMFPTFSAYQDDRTRVKQMLRRSIKMNCFIIFPLSMLLIVSAKPLVLLLLTEKWLPAVGFMQILCISNFFRPVTLMNVEAIKALGYSGVALKLEIVKKAVDITILLVSIYLNIYAIAWGMVLYDFLCVFINLFPNKKLLSYGIIDQIKDIIPVFIMTIIMGVLTYLVNYAGFNSLVTCLLQYSLGILLFLALCYFIKEESFMYILNIVKSRITINHV